MRKAPGSIALNLAAGGTTISLRPGHAHHAFASRSRSFPTAAGLSPRAAAAQCKPAQQSCLPATPGGAKVMPKSSAQALPSPATLAPPLRVVRRANNMRVVVLREAPARAVLSALPTTMQTLTKHTCHTCANIVAPKPSAHNSSSRPCLHNWNAIETAPIQERGVLPEAQPLGTAVGRERIAHCCQAAHGMRFIASAAPTKALTPFQTCSGTSDASSDAHDMAAL